MLASDACGNRRLAVGDQGGDLGFDAANYAFHLGQLIVEKTANGILHLRWSEAELETTPPSDLLIPTILR